MIAECLQALNPVDSGKLKQYSPFKRAYCIRIWMRFYKKKIFFTVCPQALNPIDSLSGCQKQQPRMFVVFYLNKKMGW